MQLADARVGDIVNVYAANPDSHQMTTTAMTVGGPTVKITGVSDGQFVRGTITPTVAGAGLDSVLWNGVDASLPSLLAPAAPFPYPLDTTKWDDGAYRLEASGRPGHDRLRLPLRDDRQHAAERRRRQRSDGGARQDGRRS